MTHSVHTEMHCEHKHLLNEIALSQEQLSHWRQEFREALGNVERLKNALTCHDEALQKHAEELDRECTRLQQHEHALVEYERGGTGAELVSMVQQHKDELARQSRARATHERIKKHHHSLMAQWRLLFDAMTNPM
jgi:hypothetical protein